MSNSALIRYDTRKLSSSYQNISHSFVFGDVLRFDSSTLNFVKAISSSSTTLANAVCVKSIDSDNFEVAFSGIYYSQTPHLLNVGENYYLSNSVSGGITNTAPAIAQRILIPISSTGIIILIDDFSRITSLNSLTSTSQTFALGTSGTDVNINSTTSTHTFNFPSSSAINRGLLTSSDWDTFNNKVSTSRSISAGTGLSGGGDLSINRSISLADTSVTPGAYTNANITVDQQGRITIASNGTSPLNDYPCCGRLTLVTGTPVMTTSQTAKTTLYFTPFKGNKIALYNGSSWDVLDFTELSLSLSGYTANSNYDIWVYNNSGTAELESTIWTNDATRATALTTQNGVYVKSGSTTRRYVGTIRTTGTTGQTEFSFGGNSAGGTEAKLFVWNYYNRISTTASVGDTTDFWSYNGTWRSWNNSATNRVSFIIGVQEDMQSSTFNGLISTGATGRVGIGYDTTTAFSGTTSAYTSTAYGFAKFSNIPTPGLHYIQAIEYAAGTVFFFGDNGVPTADQSLLYVSLNV